MPCPRTKPMPRGYEIYNFGRPSVVHNYYILSLSDPCPSVDKMSRTIFAFSLCGEPQHNNPCLRVMTHI